MTDFKFKILESDAICSIVPLLEKLNKHKISRDVLKARCLEMVQQNYECAVILDAEHIIGISGIWYCTRHYSGKSAEVDHVYIDENYRGKGLGKHFFKWIEQHVRGKGTDALELNTYVGNTGSHKFYYNKDCHIIGYHFIKKL